MGSYKVVIDINYPVNQSEQLKDELKKALRKYNATMTSVEYQEYPFEDSTPEPEPEIPTIKISDFPDEL